MFSDGKHCQNRECMSLSNTAAVPDSIRNVQDIRILQDPKAGTSWAAAECLQAAFALHQALALSVQSPVSQNI